MDYWVLDEHHNTIPADRDQWATFFDSSDDRVVRQDSLSGGVMVSTVFLGIDHSMGGKTPLLFETMVFGSDWSDYTRRYTSWDEAEIGHYETLAMVLYAKGS